MLFGANKRSAKDGANEGGIEEVDPTWRWLQRLTVEFLNFQKRLETRERERERERERPSFTLFQQDEHADSDRLSRRGGAGSRAAATSSGAEATSRETRPSRHETHSLRGPAAPLETHSRDSREDDEEEKQKKQTNKKSARHALVADQEKRPLDDFGRLWTFGVLSVRELRAPHSSALEAYSAALEIDETWAACYANRAACRLKRDESLKDDRVRLSFLKRRPRREYPYPSSGPFFHWSFSDSFRETHSTRFAECAQDCESALAAIAQAERIEGQERVAWPASRWGGLVGASSVGF